jgi:hypothetical protein
MSHWRAAAEEARLCRTSQGRETRSAWYVDNDPVVLSHARSLLKSGPRGRTAYIDADLREPARILADPALNETLDLAEPVALMRVAILHFLVDADDPAAIIRTLLSALAPGSFLVASHVTPEHDPDGGVGIKP